jgi:hypothetical protein
LLTISEYCFPPKRFNKFNIQLIYNQIEPSAQPPTASKSFKFANLSRIRINRSNPSEKKFNQ